MRLNIEDCTVQLVQGNITDQQVDAIVNAANSSLAGGGGVDGAIHRAGGREIMRETAERYPNGCPTGQAVISGAGNLPAKFVIHAVGPVWRGGLEGEPDLLRSAYQQCLELAIEHHCESVAFPALSAGAYSYPLDLAAEHSLTTVAEFLRENSHPRHVYFVLFDNGAYGAFSHALERLEKIVSNW